MWYAVAKAASQEMEKPLIDAFAPRSIRSHCGSLQAEDQRVVGSPSTAAEAGVSAPWTEEAVASAPTAMFASAAAWAARWIPIPSRPETRASTTAIAWALLRPRMRLRSATLVNIYGRLH